MRSLEVLFTPAEFAALPQRDLSRTVCVVFDVLRATTTMLTALANGAAAIVPVAEISEALALHRQRPDVLLAGERDGVRILGPLTGGVDFDLGNSPREFTPAKVVGKTIVMTTTNGTRALRACAGAKATLVAGFVNLRAVAKHIECESVENLLLVCAGTHEEAAYEDTLGAGTLCDLIWPQFADGHIADSAQKARNIFLSAQGDLLVAMRHSRNGRRLLALPELHDDVPLCLRRDSLDLLAALQSDGAVRRI
ncbi:MAG: 2-phosphosulfolactate phosphatase [Verrucomicrobia bacterium]|nr:2-phosphosulfolactate phosphatase [Verrucomicrobiota bacterium]